MRFSLLLAVLLIAGCASPRGTSTQWPWPEPPRAPQGTTTPPDDESGSVPTPIPPTGAPRQPLSTYPKTAEEISNAAVTSLVKQAREQRAAGAPDQAAAALERALRIEPRNYFVWAMLAQAHLDQKGYDQAETHALRSNSLARGNLYVEIENWRTIAVARQQRGDLAGAQAAQLKVEDIERILAGG